jgi:hypothetical protein
VTSFVLSPTFELGQDQSAGVVERGQQADLPAARPGRTTQGLAVHRERAQFPAGARAAIGQPAAQRRVQGVAVEAGQQPAHGALGEPAAPRHHRIGTQAERVQHVCGRVGDPLAHRQQRGRPGQDRARGQRQHHHRPVAHSARVARVRYLGQAFQQPRISSGTADGCSPIWSRAGSVREDAFAPETWPRPCRDHERL